MIWLDWILILIAAFLIMLAALQTSKSDISDAFSGTNSDLFKNQKERGAELLLSRTTLITSILFIVLTLVRVSVFA